MNAQDEYKIDYVKFLLQGHPIDFSQYEAKVIPHEDGVSYTVEFSRMDGKYCIRAFIEKKVDLLGVITVVRAKIELTTPFV